MDKKLFKVTTKCGHVGRNNFIYIEFPIVAESKKEASEIARWMPRAKHHDKHCILACVEINKEEYEALWEKNLNDPYLKCNNIQEQKLINNLEDRILFSKREERKRHDKSVVEYKNKKYQDYVKSYTKFNLSYMY